MPFDYGLRLDNRQRIANAREKPIEANKNQSVDGAEGLFLRSGSPQNVYPLPQRPNFSLERCPRPKQICDHPNNEPDKISHPVTASPDSRSTASQIEFATGTSPPAPKCRVKTTTRAFRPASWIETIKRKAQRGPRGPAPGPPRPPPGPPRPAPGPAPNTGFGFIGNRPSRCNFLRASLRARRTASAFSRAFFSEGFS